MTWQFFLMLWQFFHLRKELHFLMSWIWMHLSIITDMSSLFSARINLTLFVKVLKASHCLTASCLQSVCDSCWGDTFSNGVEGRSRSGTNRGTFLCSCALASRWSGIFDGGVAGLQEIAGRLDGANWSGVGVKGWHAVHWRCLLCCCY